MSPVSPNGNTASRVFERLRNTRENGARGEIAGDPLAVTQQDGDNTMVQWFTPAPAPPTGEALCVSVYAGGRLWLPRAVCEALGTGQQVQVGLTSDDRIALRIVQETEAGWRIHPTKYGWHIHLAVLNRPDLVGRHVLRWDDALQCWITHRRLPLRRGTA